MERLADKKCIPCRGGVPPLNEEAIRPLWEQVPEWEVVDNHHIRRTLPTGDFADALELANRIGALAEDQWHHPDLHVVWGKVGVEIWTHKIDGLTESDFILAAKIDQLARKAGPDPGAGRGSDSGV